MSIRTSSRNIKSSAKPWASSTSNPARWCARLTTLSTKQKLPADRCSRSGPFASSRAEAEIQILEGFDPPNQSFPCQLFPPPSSALPPAPWRQQILPDSQSWVGLRDSISQECGGTAPRSCIPPNNTQLASQPRPPHRIRLPGSDHPFPRKTRSGKAASSPWREPA